MKYSAVIAAAGLSSRMHELKPLMKLGDMSMIDSVISNLKKAGTDIIVIVLGYKADQIKKHIGEGEVIFCENKEFASTKMMDSVRLGIRETEKYRPDYVFITPVDVPLVDPESMEMMKKIAEEGTAIVRPSYDNKAGHPLLLRWDMAEKLTEYEGDDGIRGFLNEHAEDTRYINLDDPGIIMDADNKEDYKELRKMEIRKRGSKGLWFEMDIQLLKGGSVLSQESAQFLEMIDHTGSIQTACSCMHMSYSKGWTKLREMETELGYPLTIRTSGGEGGGGTELSPEGKKLLRAYDKFTKELKIKAEELFRKIIIDELS